MSKARFNPIDASRKIEESYREYIASTIHFDDSALQQQLEEILAKRNYLAKGPLLEATPPYRKDKSVRELVEEGVLCEGMLRLGGFDPDRPLYVHQVKAIRNASLGKNYVVVTGTGSGKTESFLLPILNDIMREFEQSGQTPGVRAMILYPMNALANDQLKRIRELLSGSDITFGRYTGDTEETIAKAKRAWEAENPGKKRQENELISREEMRSTPPNILLTNYSMLEYLLLRPQDAPLFKGAFGENWRHIAIDEAHVYTGTLGTEIAFLIRRLKTRIEADTGAAPSLHCYATSATIGNDDDIPKVAQFAQGLFGEPFDQSPGTPSVITSIQDPATSDLREPWGRLPLESWDALRNALLDSESDRLRDDLLRRIADYVPASECEALETMGNPLLGLGQLLLGEETTAAVVSYLDKKLLDLTNADTVEELGVPGLKGDERGIRTLTAIVEVLASALRSEDVPVLTSRYHSFMRAPEGLFVNLHDGKLLENKTTGQDDGNGNITPVYEVSVCRHCGQAYILGSMGRDDKMVWLNPEHVGTNADDDFLPRDYYRLAKPEDDLDDEASAWLCPACGSLHDSKDGGPHRFDHDDVERILLERGEATEDEAQCGHCGYRNRYAIQPMRVSPEAAGSVVCSDLARLVPPFEDAESDGDAGLFAGLSDADGVKPRSVICFSDRRQDAAFFAPAMDRTYSRVTYRQLIREAVDRQSSQTGSCSPNDAARWISTEGLRRYPVDRDDLGSRTAKMQFAQALLLDELMAEDERQSTEGLGVVRFEPEALNRFLDDEKYERPIVQTVKTIEKDGISWVDVPTFRLLTRFCVENLRHLGAVEVPQGVDSFRENRQRRTNFFVEGMGDEELPSGTIRFVGSSSGTENSRSKFIRKYASEACGVTVDRSESQLLLKRIYGYLMQLLEFMGKQERVEYLKKDPKGTYCLSSEIWALRPHSSEDVSYRCDICGCESQIDTNGVCTTNNCSGRVHATTFASGMDKDRYYKSLYMEEALPLRIEEHTAQLSTERARAVQKDFIDGKVHILSCTTTFELGVDVGDLRAVFMRNVPPSTANYTQRAGRTGRRAGMPSYAITFARLRPHDIAFFRNPAGIIRGKMNPPHCYMDNDVIALRHVFAIALSQFFRDTYSPGITDYARIYNDFLDLEKSEPEGLSKLSDYLRSNRVRIESQLDGVFDGLEELAEHVGIRDWSWVEELVDPRRGRLEKTHELKHSDYMRLKNGAEENREENLPFAHALERQMSSLKKERTIGILAENGILPKYGFPTDLVELSLLEQRASSHTDSLQLQRGLRQAVTEYAPGAEIVAAKRLWRSVGIHKLRGREWETRNYEKCPKCGNFVWAIENGVDDAKCECCGETVFLKKRMLVPSYGFDGEEAKDKSIGSKRPRTIGRAKVFFSQQWPDEVAEDEITLPGGSLRLRYANNARLCVLNEGKYRQGYNVCGYCGAAAPVGGRERVPHKRYCKDKKPSFYSSIGTSFTSDVLELAFVIHTADAEESDWESTMWALIAASNEMLETPQSELGGTMYSTSSTMSLMLYDDVPGGAGHVLQLSERPVELFERAFEIVDTCTCSEETCCYGCICNYYNQSKQHELSRGGARKILGALLGKE